MANIAKYNTRVVMKHDTEGNWNKATGFIPLKGEIIIYDDLNKIKIGDGKTNVVTLPFALPTPADIGLGNVDNTSDANKPISSAMAAALSDKADKSEGAFYIEGSGTTDSTAKTSTWIGTSSRITSYYDGLTIRYKIGVAGQTTTTLNINNLGAKTVYRFNTTKLTTQFPVGSIINLIYHSDLNGGCWVTNDYDANTNTQMRVYRQTTGYNADYPLLVSRTKAADIATKDSNGSYEALYGVMWNDTTKVPTLNPSTGEMKAVKFTGAFNGNATTATSATKATKDAKDNTIDTTYETKNDASAKLTEAKAYTDTELAKKELFIAIPGQTTFQEIVDAVNAGRIVRAIVAGNNDDGIVRVFYPLVLVSPGEGAVFIATDGLTVAGLTVTPDNQWEGMEIPLLNADEYYDRAMIDSFIDGLWISVYEKVPTSRTINGKALTDHITLEPSDIGTLSTEDINESFMIFENIIKMMFAEDMPSEDTLIFSSIRSIAEDAIAKAELITTADIDTICGTTIQVASEEGVTF